MSTVKQSILLSVTVGDDKGYGGFIFELMCDKEFKNLDTISYEDKKRVIDLFKELHHTNIEISPVSEDNLKIQVKSMPVEGDDLDAVLEKFAELEEHFIGWVRSTGVKIVRSAFTEWADVNPEAAVQPLKPNNLLN